MSKYSWTEYTLTSDDLSKMLGYNREYVCQLTSKGRIPGMKILGEWRFCKKEIQTFLAPNESSDNFDSTSTDDASVSDLIR